jgi:hypothetical protein
MVFNEFKNASSELLAVFLVIQKEGASNKVFRIEDRGRWWLCIDLIRGSAGKCGLIHGGSICEGSNMGRTLPSRHASTYIGIIRSCRTQQWTINDDIWVWWEDFIGQCMTTMLRDTNNMT